MNIRLTIIASVAGIMCFSGAYSRGEIKPVPFNRVRLTDGFWQERMETELSTTVPFSVMQSDRAVERFRRCADFLAGRDTDLPETHRFISSDLYKVMEGVAYSLMIRPDAELERFMDETIDLIAASQEEDGYIYISHTCGNPAPHDMGETRYSFVVHSHELYNVGHMYEAAVAYYQATGKDKLLKVSEKNARHIYNVFFVGGDPKYNDGIPVNQAPGHQELELALCKMYRVTGDRFYLDLAKRFMDIRGVTYRPEGTGTMSPSYAQQHLPVAGQREAVGHSVRALYQYTAMAQIDALTGRNDYGDALDAIWKDLTHKKMHITGGLGAIAGVEGFGAPYDLPNLTTYNETCAAVANVFFNHGMFLNTGDGRYLDVAELSLFNNALAGINLAGDRFFYVNPLEADGNRKFNHGVGGRAEWFECACCPPNISRLILQVPGYMYSYSEDRIYLTLYGGSSTTVQLENTVVAIEQRSAYPFDGNVEIKLEPDRDGAQFAVLLRLPEWATGGSMVPGGLYNYADAGAGAAIIKVNGREMEYIVEDGFAVVNRNWNAGDQIELNIPMPVRYVTCDPKVKYNRGLVSIARGPLVYCAEEIDNGTVVQNLIIDKAGSEIPSVQTFNKGPLEGIEKIILDGKIREGDSEKAAKVTMVPYYAWNNRGDDRTMRVWMNYDGFTEGEADYLPAVWITGVTSGSDGTTQWTEYTVAGPATFNALSVKWVDEGEVTVPAQWNVQYKAVGSEPGWQDLRLYITDSYQTAADRFNVVHPAAEFEYRAIRINMTPQEGRSAAIAAIELE